MPCRTSIFRRGRSLFLIESRGAEFWLMVAGSDPRESAAGGWFLSYLHGGYEAASRNEPGRFISFAHYLPKSFRAR
jgi:hypothetical protein